LKVYHDTRVEEVLGDKKLEGIKLSNGEIITCDGIFVAIGRKPNTELFDVELSKDGYIKVNQKLETSIPGVFAAGDVCEKYVRQIVTACADGAIAATHATEYTRPLEQTEYAEFGARI
jgi:thioredoxin reductase (NADPH)